MKKKKQIICQSYGTNYIDKCKTYKSEFKYINVKHRYVNVNIIICIKHIKKRVK